MSLYLIVFNNEAFINAIYSGKVIPVSPDYIKIQDDINKIANYMFNDNSSSQ